MNRKRMRERENDYGEEEEKIEIKIGETALVIRQLPLRYRNRFSFSKDIIT